MPNDGAIWIIDGPTGEQFTAARAALSRGEFPKLIFTRGNGKQTEVEMHTCTPLDDNRFNLSGPGADDGMVYEPTTRSGKFWDD